MAGDSVIARKVAAAVLGLLGSATVVLGAWWLVERRSRSSVETTTVEISSLDSSRLYIGESEFDPLRDELEWVAVDADEHIEQILAELCPDVEFVGLAFSPDVNVDPDFRFWSVVARRDGVFQFYGVVSVRRHGRSYATSVRSEDVLHAKVVGILDRGKSMWGERRCEVNIRLETVSERLWLPGLEE